LVLYGQGAAAADYNNDGFEDLLVTAYRRTVLLANMGDGTFRDVSEEAGVTNTRWSTSAGFADLDLDGDLDFYAACYAIVSAEKPRVCQKSGVRMHCLPQVFESEPDLLYRNLGDGRFEECSVESGIEDDRGRGLGLAIADFNRDGLPDIFVSNDTTENYLFVNQGGFKFKEQAVTCGAALTGEGSTMSGMGVTCADYDANGYLDNFVCNFYEEKNVLFENLGGDGFVDSSDALGLAHTSRDKLTFGCAFLDADLDGYPDLFVANGHVSDLTALGVPYRMRPQIYRNLAGKRFVDQSSVAGLYFHRQFIGRGCAVADWNNDGLPDLVVSHIRDQAALLVNSTKP
ncbi:MAG TPA: VCBS repeat-containing protein, partial [Planctomycetaceae bacterium]|nr:VCBS repeat-containing protein [Planctomycetaceae bacterium]